MAESRQVSDCCSYPVGDDGVCNWCGKDSGTHPRSDDLLLDEIRSVLCDWNRPSQLASFDLWENIHTVAVLIRKHADAS